MKGTLLITVIAILFFSFQEKREMVVSENQVLKLINKWNDLQGKRDSAKLVRFYADDEILWNGKAVTLSQILEEKFTRFTTPILKHDIPPKSLVLKGYTARGGLIKCNFTQLRKIDDKVREYPYYILLVKESGKLKIAGEGEGELVDETLLGLPMEIIDIDVKDTPDKGLIVISGRSYFYPMITSVILAVLVTGYVIIKKRNTMRQSS
jgi:hypothetical protein